ncbi:helix-turn-helix domain-containing protein [Sodalis sp. RH21]|uniref:helix-turn-helix domain-containing protein n=1 Tax=unclassified Sodalis (in: enterobacteria) TaxID=2636512 RepID=UPI0039B5F4A9
MQYRIKELRLAKAWSQEQLAELASLSVRTVQRIENGEQASLETLAAIASAFELGVTDLYSAQAAPVQQEQARAIDERLVKIRKQIAAQADFYRQIAGFIITSVILLLINWLTSHAISWSGIVIAILGILLIKQGVNTFIINNRIEKWKANKITNLLNK